MPGTGNVTVVMTGLVGEPGDKIVQDEDGTSRLVKAADLAKEAADDCDDEVE